MPDSVVGGGKREAEVGNGSQIGWYGAVATGGGDIEEETVLGEKDAFHF